jgi:hypothetical protein
MKVKQMQIKESPQQHFIQIAKFNQSAKQSVKP